MPFFRGGAKLDAKLVEVQAGRGSFDLVVRLSTLHKGHKIDIPTRRTGVLNKWTAKPLAKIISGCELSKDGMILWVELPDLKEKTEGDILGIDIGVNKLVVDSNNRRYGTQFKYYRDRVKRRKPGSDGRRRAQIERDQYINRVVKQLPWKELRAIGVEDLLNVKKGKPKDKNGRNKRSKSFRKAMAPWTYRRVLSRARALAQENRVRLVAVPPAYTSRVCPQCGVEQKENRRGENFLCVGCGYKADADHVGAQNVLARTLATIGSVEAPMLN
jgi:transposase